MRSAANMIALAAFLALCAGQTARADEWSDCVRGAASAMLAASTEFQRGLRDLVVRHRPEFDALATISRDLQVKLAELRRAEIDYLLSHDRDRINTGNGLSRFSNFGWSDADTDKFARESEPFRRLSTEAAALRKANDTHPDWPAMRNYFRSGLNASPDFKALMDRLRRAHSAVEARLAGCRRK